MIVLGMCTSFLFVASCPPACYGSYRAAPPLEIRFGPSLPPCQLSPRGHPGLVLTADDCVTRSIS